MGNTHYFTHLFTITPPPNQPYITLPDRAHGFFLPITLKFIYLHRITLRDLLSVTTLFPHNRRSYALPLPITLKYIYLRRITPVIYWLLPLSHHTIEGFTRSRKVYANTSHVLLLAAEPQLSAISLATIDNICESSTLPAY